jgi:hypothetical protein
MARPRPLPPFWRESDASTCWKRPKIVVDDGERNAVRAGAQHHRDGCVRRRELDGIGKQIGDHLQQAVAVGGDLGLDGIVNQLHAGRFRHRLHSVDGLLDDLSQLHAAEGQRLAAALDALEIEDVVNEPDQAIGVCKSDAQQVGRFLIHLAQNARGEQPQRATDGSKRRAQLMAYRGDELVFQPVERIALADVVETDDRT